MAAISSRTFLAALEGIPWETHCVWDRGQLTVEREVDESGFLHVPWNIDGVGEVMLSTSTLMERFEPYILQLELARGTINRLRNQMAQWEQLGLKVDEAMLQRVHATQRMFAKAVARQNDLETCVAMAESCIASARADAEALGEIYAKQTLALRCEGNKKLPTMLGARIDGLPPTGPLDALYSAAFNATLLSASWREVEGKQSDAQWANLDRRAQWAKDKGLKTIIGPLVQLDRRHLPDWSYLWEDDFDEFRDFQRKHVRSVVERLRGKAQVWYAAGRMNVEGAMAYDEEKMLRLTVDAIETIRSADPRTPLIVGFDQPWSEHMAERDRDLPPMYFADTLARADIGVAGFALEFNWGWWPRGTSPRDVLELSRMIDRWQMLGLPLMILFSAPSSPSNGSVAVKGKPPTASDPGPVGKARPLTPGLEDVASAEWQRQAFAAVAPVLIAKANVHAVIWNQWSDSQPYEFPAAGLVDEAGRPKPGLSWLSGWRKEYLE